MRRTNWLTVITLKLLVLKKLPLITNIVLIKDLIKLMEL